MKEINEVADLIKLVKGFSEFPSEMIYRGQNQDWELLPSLFRIKKESNLRIERELFKRLKLNRPILPSDLEDSFDFLIFAQQHSMKTRLLDWTYNPLIALWFACFNKEKEFSKDGVVYILDATKLSDARVFSKSYNESADAFKDYLDKIEELQKLIPSHLFERLASQFGVFTVFPNSPNFKNLNILKFVIPSHKKVGILKELGKLKINEYSIYKDFDSLCKTIYWEVYSNKLLLQDDEPLDYIDISEN